MLIIMTSPESVLRNGKPDPKIVQTLINTRTANNPVGFISNHSEPAWFADTFGGSNVQFLQSPGRQSGDIVAKNAKKFSLNPYDVLVLATKNEDVQMGKNGGAVLVAAGWSTERDVLSLGIRVDNSEQLEEVIKLSANWSGQWWFSADKPLYKIRALADLSGYSVSNAQEDFGRKLTVTVKNGGSRLNALLAVTARSLLADGTISDKDLLWGVYPSSNSNNTDGEVLSDFAHRLRTTVSRVRYAKRDEPLFIRHTPSAKRSKGAGGDRNDPTAQILSIHLNSYYKTNNRIKDKHVIIIDDCTTYGVSFGVAAAFLHKAGAASITGVALGKFGNQLKYHHIDIKTDPFSPIQNSGFTFNTPTNFEGTNNSNAQKVLLALIQ